MQYGQVRGLLSAVTELDVQYTRFMDDYPSRGIRKSEKFWRVSVVLHQEKLPENVLREFCRAILWQPVLPDFKTLSAPPPAVLEDGLAPFDLPWYCIRHWGIYHGNNAFARLALNERGYGIGVNEARRVVMCCVIIARKKRFS